MSVHICCTSSSVVGRGYSSAGLRATRRRILWMTWYLQVRECCGRGGGFFHVAGLASICVCTVAIAQIQGNGPRGRPSALDQLRQAEHCQSQVVARLP